MKQYFLLLTTSFLLFTACGGGGGNSTTTPPVLETVDIVVDTFKKTGQLKSYDRFGNEIFDGIVRDDGYYQKGTTQSYTRDDTNETVIDNLTGLIWQDDTAVTSLTKQWLTDDNLCISDNSTCLDTTGDTATTYCSELVMGGYEDWRLATRKELVGIVDYGRDNSSISPAFQNTLANYYWTSTPDANISSEAWTVNFVNGGQDGYSKFKSAYVRCVRIGE